jgi:hypothetical protein
MIRTRKSATSPQIETAPCSGVDGIVTEINDARKPSPTQPQVLTVVQIDKLVVNLFLPLPRPAPHCCRGTTLQLRSVEKIPPSSSSSAPSPVRQRLRCVKLSSNADGNTAPAPVAHC